MKMKSIQKKVLSFLIISMILGSGLLIFFISSPSAISSNTNSTWTQTTYDDFNSGTFTNTTVSGKGTDANITLTSTMGVTWTQATVSAEWSAREYHTSVIFDNKIWVIGGIDAKDDKNDVWYSINGINWTQVTARAPWKERWHHTSVVFYNKIWVIGGCYIFDAPGYCRNDVWYSTDGITWFCSVEDAPWTERRGQTSVVFDKRIWIIGGSGGSSVNQEFYNDIWYSIDGANWTDATSAQWSAREGHSSVVFDDKIWVIGGKDINGYKNDVWYSTEGINWTQAIASAPWSPRNDHTVIVFDDMLWLIGGGGNDVWYSPDGANWHQAAIYTQWSGRSGHASVAIGNKLWVIGGSSSDEKKNDVWCSGFYPHSGTFVSRIFDSNGIDTKWNTINWAETLTPNTDITFATRTGDIPSPDNSWSIWSSELIDPSGSTIPSTSARYFQYRATLSTTNTNNKPALNNVTVRYTPTNGLGDDDGDGYSDDSDQYPGEDDDDYLDDDNDGYVNNKDKYPNKDDNEFLDNDNDSYVNNQDDFRDDPNEWIDSDSDGVGDNSDAFPKDPTQWLDSDNDGYGDNPKGNNPDAYPYDPEKWSDDDSAGFGGQITLSWEKSKNPDFKYYEIYLSIEPDFSNSSTPFTKIYNKDITTYTVTGLEESKTYYAFIREVYGENKSQDSDKIAVVAVYPDEKETSQSQFLWIFVLIIVILAIAVTIAIKKVKAGTKIVDKSTKYYDDHSVKIDDHSKTNIRIDKRKKKTEIKDSVIQRSNIGDTEEHYKRKEIK